MLPSLKIRKSHKSSFSIFLILTIFQLISLPIIGQANRDVSLEDVCRSITIKSRNIDSLKALLSYQWVVKNIKYDYKSLYTISYGGDYDTSLTTPEIVFHNKTATCWGISKIYKRMCDVLNVKCEVIYGVVRGFYIGKEIYDGREPHAWNIITLGSKEYQIDCTFGTNRNHLTMEKLGRLFEKPTFFCMPPEKFVLQHYADSAKFNLGFTDLTILQFLDIPFFGVDYFDYFNFNKIDLVNYLNRKVGVDIFF